MNEKLKFHCLKLGKSVTAEVTEKVKVKTSNGKIFYIAKAIYKGIKVCRFINKALYSIIKIKK